MFEQRLQKLRHILYDYDIEGYIVPSTDPYQNETPPEGYQRLKWLTGFTGSYGLAIILGDRAAFFTDGRYILQARQEINNSDYEIFNYKDKKPWEWLNNDEINIGYDPMLHLREQIINYAKSTPVEFNLIDRLWYERPELPSSKIMSHSVQFTGMEAEDKINLVVEAIKKHKTEAAIITSPDSICWLLNVRGSDVPYTPLILGYAIVYIDGSVEWFVENSRKSDVLVKNVTVYSRNLMVKRIEQLRAVPVLMDTKIAPIWFLNHLDNVVDGQDPCLLAKACKNATEINGIKNAHIRDGAAVTKFLCWLDQNLGKNKITEITAANKLTEFRRENEHFVMPSFATISGFAEHGAIVHYHANEESDAEILKDNIYLLDSGGQYNDGTTDITRTIATGKTTKQQREHFTLVLKGHIALAEAVFPHGTTGSALDVLARQYLWQYGLDYDHGTGHGVGCFLNVHEGPQRISKFANNIALLPGMIISNEPGYYLEGEYGIRIENLIMVVDRGDGFYGFETLTFAPIDSRLIDYQLLSDLEKDWLHSYHEQVKACLKPLLSFEEKRWLENLCSFRGWCLSH